MTTKIEDYKGIRGGTNKAKVRMVFDDKGADAAIKKAEALGLQVSTARTWCSSWKNDSGKKAVAKKATAKVSKKAVKAKATKPAPAKKAARPARKAAKAAPAEVAEA